MDYALDIVPSGDCPAITAVASALRAVVALS